VWYNAVVRIQSTPGQYSNEVFSHNPHTLNKAFGCKVAVREDKPTNGEFIAMIADKLALEQRSA